MHGRVLPESDHAIPQRARCLLGNRTGVVASLLNYLPDRGDPTAFYSTAVESDVGWLADTDAGSLDAGGASLRFSGSVMSALGEAMERYSLYFPDGAELTRASHRELSRARQGVVEFDYLDVHEPSQLRRAGLEPLARDDVIDWQPARNVLTGDDVYVPAELVWMGLADGGNRSYFPTTSNGCACGDTPAMALLAALAECVERDAIMRAWYEQADTRAISVVGRPDLEATGRRLETHTLGMHWFEVESAIDVPVVGCGAVDTRDRAPKFALGGASSVDRTRAYTGAAVEAAQTMVYLKELVAEGYRADDVDLDEIFGLRDNLLYYARPENFAEVSFLLGEGSGVTPTIDDRPTDGVESRLRSYLSMFREADLTPLAVDLTPRDVRELGYTVVRAIVPELVGLTLPSLPPVNHPAFSDGIATRRPHPYP